MKKNKITKTFLIALGVFFSNTLIANAAGNEYIACGSNSIPAPIAPIIRTIVLLLQIVLPLVIIVVGSLDFFKAVAAADQEKIKKNQNQFLSRLKAGAIFFFVVVVIKFAISIVADQTDNASISNCIDCLINDETKCGEITTNNPFIDTTNNN